MTKKREEILKKAKDKARKLKKLRQDERYKFVLGRLKYEKLLDVEGVQARNYKLHLNDVLWVGENIEPRVLEILPAILIKKPSLIYQAELPEDLKAVKNQIKRKDLIGSFRGIPIKAMDYWVPLAGRKGKRPSMLKTFRLNEEDLKKLKKLSQKYKITETEVIRRALQEIS